ncbi:AAA family ATPase [Mycena sanguinolenta]|uniref:AAA family ATPase n=1 Tax=Mycena sanguinolenta TaxID=230812 RepID=A0A8H6XBP0_9AGAR|nr:AAA family ATPase [Mycena sanguinolenta]
MSSLLDAGGWLLSAILNAESYVNDIDTLAKVNGLTPDEPVVVPPVGASASAAIPSTYGVAPPMPQQVPDMKKLKEEMEMLARKKELDALNAEYMEVPYGSKAELVHLEKRWDKNGDEYYIRQDKAASRIVGTNWWEKHILVVIRHFTRISLSREKENVQQTTTEAYSESVQQTTVEVYSEHLRKILARVISDYPGISFRTKHISLTFPAHSLYHYLSELRAEAETLEEGSVELEHLNVLLDFIETQFADIIEQVKNLRPQNLITYDTLWTLFRPGTIIHSKVRGYDRAFQLQAYYVKPEKQEDAGFYCVGTYTDYDGENFGMRLEDLQITPFTGSTHIATLSVAPLDMRARKDELRMALIERGKRFQLMRGQCHGEYVGVAIDQGENDMYFTRYMPRPRGNEAEKKFSIKSRVMIDGKSYNRICADFSWEADDEETNRILYGAEDNLSAEERVASKARKAAEKGEQETTDEETLLCTNILRGFSFADKKWCQLFIENFSEISWNQRLVLPEDSKNLILALVSSHLGAEERRFSDIIKGKGRGLVMVLHGAPGVGKTLTAECIAEYTRRPLYVISSGDLGTTAADLEWGLTRILDLAHTWKAILLIDEVNTYSLSYLPANAYLCPFLLYRLTYFLEKRTLTDVHRNALVSVFLRLLEYYEGILFLTTNRINTFDPAFQSRIHQALKYENLAAPARKRLWKDFLGKLKGGANISEEGYDLLAQYNINGREIKNAVKTAESLASFMKQPLSLEYLKTVLKTHADFAEALTKK